MSAESSPLSAAAVDPEERRLEAALRPKHLDEFVGQMRVREQLDLMLASARLRDRAADHVLLSGPPGLGKTTLAMIIAQEMGVALRVTSGPAITHAGDLASILSGLESSDREGNDVGAVRTAVRILKENGTVGIFPQGHRGGTAMQGGVALIAARGRSPILPAGISRDGKRWIVRFGPPIEARGGIKGTTEELDRVLKELAQPIGQKL